MAVGILEADAAGATPGVDPHFLLRERTAPVWILSYSALQMLRGTEKSETPRIKERRWCEPSFLGPTRLGFGDSLKSQIFSAHPA